MPVRQQIENLYTDHHGWLLAWLRRRVGCGHRAADLAQDTFVRLLASRDALLGVQQPRAYLTAVAKRLLVDRSRRQVIEQAYLADLALAASAQAGAPSPEEILLAVQALEEISAALEGLPDKVREAFLRHYLDEQTQARIAEDMQVSKRTIQNYLVRALLHCRTASSQMPMLP